MIPDIGQLTLNELHDLESACRARRLELDTLRRRTAQARDMGMGRTVPSLGGEHICSFCEDLCYHAKRVGGAVTGKFNGKRLSANPESTPETVYRQFLP